jgi:hypothetical protein
MSVTLPSLTLWQPWASLIAIGAKRYETRGRPPPTRLIGQRIAIHAAVRRPRWTEWEAEAYEAVCNVFGHRHWLRSLPLGAVVCTAILIEALPVERVPHDLFGNYAAGRWAWRLEDVRPIGPVPARGQQLWGWPWRVPDGLTV